MASRTHASVDVLGPLGPWVPGSLRFTRPCCDTRPPRQPDLHLWSQSGASPPRSRRRLPQQSYPHRKADSAAACIPTAPTPVFISVRANKGDKSRFFFFFLCSHLRKGVCTIPLNDCVHSKCNSKLVAVVVAFVVIGAFTQELKHLAGNSFENKCECCCFLVKDLIRS